MESNLESSRPFKSTEIIADLQNDILMLIKRSVFDVNSAIRFRSNLFKIIDENIKEIENKEFRAVVKNSLVAFAEKSISDIITKFNLRVLTILIFFDFTKNNKLIDLKQSQQTINETIGKIPIRTIQSEFISLANSQPKVKTQSLQSYSELNERYNENKEMVSGLKAKTNLVICDTHSNCSARCFPWQGRVYSLDGTYGTTSDGRKYVPLEVATNVRDKYGNTNGLLGFNCRHKLTEYRDGKEPLTVSKQEQKKQYALNNEQRLYEREIRANKQKADMSILEADKSKYRQKARDLTAKYKAFCQDNKLVEYRSRLKI